MSMRAFVGVCGPGSETQDSHGVFAKNTELPARETRLKTDGHATAPPLRGPTGYDLHLNVEEEDGRDKGELDRGEMKWTGDGPVCLL